MYQDEDGNKIAENDEIEGIVGKEYTTSRNKKTKRLLLQKHSILKKAKKLMKIMMMKMMITIVTIVTQVMFIMRKNNL